MTWIALWLTVITIAFMMIVTGGEAAAAQMFAAGFFAATVGILAFCAMSMLTLGRIANGREEQRWAEAKREREGATRESDQPAQAERRQEESGDEATRRQPR